MADTTIAALPAATSISGSDTIIVLQGGVDKKAAVSLLPSGSGGAALTNAQKRDLVMPFRGTGILARTMDGVLATGNTTIVSNVPRFLGAVRLLAGDVHTSLRAVSSSTAGAGITEARMFLTDTTGVILARSADISASISGAWAANTLQTFTFETAYTPSVDTVALAVIAITATTVPNFVGAVGALAGVLASASAVRDPATWGGGSTAGVVAGSYPAVGATISLPTTKTTTAYADVK